MEILSGQLDGRLIGFRPAVAEKDPVRKAVIHQPGGQFDLGKGIIEIGYMNQLLLPDRSGPSPPRDGHGQGCTPRCRRQNPYMRVRRCPTGYIPPPCNHQGKPFVCGRHHPVRLCHPFAGIHSRLFHCHNVTSVPMPLSVKSSSSSACRRVPLMICTF